MINIIVAYDSNRVIGADNGLLWRISEDMHHFKNLTINNVCIMGRKTWESLPEKNRPLPKRLNIVVTANPSYVVPLGVLKAKSLIDAIHLTEKINDYNTTEIFICGGESLYIDGLRIADRIWATEIHNMINTANKRNIKYFPTLNQREWSKTSEETITTQDQKYRLSFVVYQRTRKQGN
jgi:dihydrofolate reductase